MIPKLSTWIKAAARTFEPATNSVMLSDNFTVTYRYPIMCPGLKPDWDDIFRSEGTPGRNNVFSNYSASAAEYTWRCLQNFRGGNALFSQPAMPIKGAGAPQKNCVS